MLLNNKLKKLCCAVSLLSLYVSNGYGQSEEEVPPPPPDVSNMGMVDQNQPYPATPLPPPDNMPVQPPPDNMPVQPPPAYIPPPPTQDVVDDVGPESEGEPNYDSMPPPEMERSIRRDRSATPVAVAPGIVLPPVEEKKKAVVKEKTISAAEKNKICNKYDNKFISHYSDVFKVEKCKRLALNSDQVYAITRDKKSIVSVNSDVLIALPLKGDFNKPNKSNTAKIDCSRLNGKYVSYHSGDVYYVEKCKKRPFAYWSDYEGHRAEVGKGNLDIIPLSDKEFEGLKEGEVISLKLKDAYWNNIVQHAIDTIPIDEACAGVEGKYVSYIDQIYRIEKCRKREISESIVKSKKLTEKKLRELSSEQWISMPLGAKILK